MAENKLASGKDFPTVPCQIYQSLHDEVCTVQNNRRPGRRMELPGACIDYTARHAIGSRGALLHRLRNGDQMMQDRFDGKRNQGDTGQTECGDGA